jgi:preprotein translocase subunit SecA
MVAAREEMKRLQPFAASLDSDARQELQTQKDLIEAIDRGIVEKPHPFGRRFPDTERTIQRKETKVGRNDPCPCGSGKKYKKWCSP